jgi:hypothetical protein
VVENIPAFPCEAQGDREVPPEHDYIQTGINIAKFPGMTLRDFFAAHAMPTLLDRACEGLRVHAEEIPAFVAARAYELADAMLTARSARTTGEG